MYGSPRRRTLAARTSRARMIPFAGQVWRIVNLGQNPEQPAFAPEGRFHHSGQTAIYTSLSPEGCSVAIARYIHANDPAREIVLLQINALRILDMRGNPDLSVVWQDIRAAGAPAPTWAFSNAARDAGAQGLLYSSRSRPDLSHLVLFPTEGLGLRAISAQPWQPGR